MVHSPSDPHQAQHVERYEGRVKAHIPEPERPLAPVFIQLVAERFRIPVVDGGEHPEQHATDDDVVEMGNQEQTVVQYKVSRRHGQQHTGHAANGEGHHERDRPHHRQLEADTAAVHGEQPVKQLGAGGDGNNHRGNPEEGIHAGPCPHGEEMV